MVEAGNPVLCSFSGACVRRVIDRSHALVREHAHGWPVLSLFVIGSYWNETEAGTSFICGPSAVFYGAGAPHRNRISDRGFEQIEIEFDPAWLGQRWLPSEPVVLWLGGRTAMQARALARSCAQASDRDLRGAVQHFFATAQHPERRPAGWVGAIARRLSEDTTLKISELARAASRHPSWVGSAYKQATGEGLQDTAARYRVESATRLLRETDDSYVSIALGAGFCDQSHMNRTFRRVLGRTPAAVREDRRGFRQVPV